MDVIECSVCGEIHPISELMYHMSQEHPHFLVTLASIAMPGISSESLFQWLQNVVVDSFVPDPDLEDDGPNSYEYYTDFCDMIGNHYVGVDDIEKVAPALCCDKTDKCPICIEPMNSCIYGRKITRCKHLFCGPCIETWLEKHKTCPVCKVDVTDLKDQMASMSISSEEPDASTSNAAPSATESSSINNT